mgnify:CR=1 FL=1
MKSVKQMCLGVAVAGVVVGAGSTVATAVASAEPASPDATQTADTTEAGSSTTAGSRPQARDRSARSRAAAATGGAPGLNGGASPSGRATSTNAATTNTATTVETPNNNRPRASVLQRAPRTAATRATRTVNIGAESVSVPIGAASQASATGQPDEQVAAPAMVVAAPVAFAAVPALPAPAPVPLLPLPTLPALPVAPATAVTVSSASSTTTRRGANAVAAIQVTEPTHVLLIGVDGVNMSKVLEYAYDEPTSGFRILMDEGVTGTTSFVGHTTLSGPSWSTVLTGAWDDKTGVFNNIFNPRPYDAWPTAINLIEYHAPEVDTAVFANWQYINDIADAGGYPADINEFVEFDTSWEVTDDLVVLQTIELIETTSASDSAFIFSYQVAVDEAGHEAGGDSDAYKEALLNTSKNLAAIMAAIDIWEAANPGQEWTVITTTDHGHQPQAGFGHGFQSPDETASWVIFDLEDNDTDDGLQNLGYSNVDITPTIVELFGIEQRSDFDGAPLQGKNSGVIAPVDLKQSLTDALGTYGFPDPITDFTLSVRTIVGAVPYFLNIFVEDITGFLQGVVEQEIFLISTLAQVAEFAVGFLGGVLVDVTQVIAGVVARLTGSGAIAPTDPPLPPPPAGSVRVPVLLPAAVLV